MADYVDFQWREEAFLELELDTGVSKQPNNVFHVVDLFLRVFRGKHDAVQLNQAGPPSDPDKRMLGAR